MIRSALLMMSLLLGSAANDASAAEVTVVYKGVVTGASGPLASSFTPGQSISIRYVVETSTPDYNASSDTGVYFQGLRQLAVEIPGAGLAGITVPGDVVVYNNVQVPPADFAFFSSYGMTSSVSLGGRTIWGMEVRFQDWTAAMLTTDALPSTHLSTVESFVLLRTDNATDRQLNYVYFVAEPELPAATCASDGYTGTKLTWCQNICEKGYTGSTLNLWIRRWIDRYRSLPACAAPLPQN